MENPIIASIPEESCVKTYLEEMGFEVKIVHLEDDDEELDRRYAEEGQPFESLGWNPKSPEEGFILLSTWDHEDGPMAAFVKPDDNWSRAVLDLSIAYMEQA